jgi:hypothetical protein
MRTHKTAGQEPFAAGSRIPTHSTWCVIGTMCTCRPIRKHAGQRPFGRHVGRDQAGASVKRASRAGPYVSVLTHAMPHQEAVAAKRAKLTGGTSSATGAAA